MKDSYFGTFFSSQISFSNNKKRKLNPQVTESLSKGGLENDTSVGGDYWTIRGVIILVILITTFLAFTLRLTVLGVIKHDYYKLQSLENRSFKKAILPERGVIVDKNGVVIARNAPGFRLLLNLGGISSDTAELIKTLAADLEMSESEIIQKVNTDKGKNNESIVIKSNIAKEKASFLESKYSRNPFVSIETAPIRENTFPFSTSHLVGYVGEDSGGEKIGVSGLEKYYENYLQGVAGYSLLETDSLGRIVKEVDTVKPQAGDLLVLNIDVKLQEFSYNALKDKIGSVVIQSVTDGSPVVLVNSPSFNSDLFNNGISKKDYKDLLDDVKNPLFGRAVSGQYPPGSVFKTIVAAAALSEGTINKDKIVNVPASISIGSFVFKDWKESGHGLVDVTRALGVSSDVFFYGLGGGVPSFGIRGLGVEKISEYAARFGLGKSTGIDLPQEAVGFLPNRDWKKSVYGEEWYIGDDFITAIGQGFILTTPLQMNNATVVLANGGYLYKPKIVSRIKLTNGEEIVKDAALLNSNIASSEVLSIVREGMRKACSIGGTAYPLFDFAPKVGCKTGTSEYGEKDKYGNYKTHAWIIVFAPFDNPKYALTVFLEGGGEGSKDAAPVARSVLEEMVRRGLL